MYDIVLTIGYFFVICAVCSVVVQIVIKKRTVRHLFGEMPNALSVVNDLKFLPVIFIFCTSLILVLCWLLSYFNTELVVSLLLPPDDGSDVLSQLHSLNTELLVLTVILAVVLLPLIEEVAFRGMLQYHLEKIGRKLSLIVSSLIFGLMHEELLSIIFAVAGGVVYGILFIKYQGILVPLVYHILDNFLAFIISFFYTGDYSNDYYIRGMIDNNFQNQYSSCLLCL
jgi:uncharacterized protein